MDRVSYTEVELHISPLNDFTRRYGQRVKACGGRYSECRGYSTARIVHLPAGEMGLIDAIAKDFIGSKGKTVMIARGIEGAGVSLPSWVEVHYWTPSVGKEPSAFLSEKFRRTLKRMDWAAIRARQQEAANAHAALKVESERRNEIDDLKERIVAEALKLLDGRNDIDDLKQLAARLRQLGWEPEPGVAPEPSAPSR